jgi:ABC-2 type transport system permease protein
LSSLIKQLENFAGIMNFVIFPMLFLSSALYPLWKIRESSYLIYQICSLNPFNYAVELIRFALYSQFNWEACLYTLISLIFFLGAAIYAYDPARGMVGRKLTTSE